MIHWDITKRFPRSDRGTRIKYWVVCEECGAGRWLRTADIKQIGPRHWCSECGPRLAHSKGGRRTRPDGYQRVLAPAGHPHPCEEKRGVAYILEHRLIMERALGRYLEPGEIVHHRNGDPSDNRLENLELCASQSVHIREHHGKHNHSRAAHACAAEGDSPRPG